MFAPLLASSILPYLAALRTPVRAARCHVRGLALLGGRATLYADRIEVTGWMWRGRFHRVVSLSSLVEVSWEPRTHRRTLRLVLVGGETLPLVLRHAGQWKYLLHQRLTDSASYQPLAWATAAAV